jgi:hypothetical protein
MPVCEALTKKGHPCRGHGMPADNKGHLCHMHRDYFTDHKIDKHLTEIITPYMTDTERGWMFRALRSPLYQRKSIWFIQHLHSLEGDQYHRANKLYELYVMAGVVAPMASLQFLRRCITTILRVLAYEQTYDATTRSIILSTNIERSTQMYFRPFVNGLPHHVFLPYLLISMRTPFDICMPFAIAPLATRKECSAQIWRELLTHIVPLMPASAMMCANLEPILARIDEENEDDPDSIWWVPGVREHLLSTLKSRQLVGRAAAKGRMEPLREELMMTAWHPDRVLRWLEAGIEMEDM